VSVRTVRYPGGEYPIWFEPGLLQTVARDPERFGLAGRVAVVANSQVTELYGNRMAETLPNAVCISFPEGERFKTLKTVADLYDAFIAHRLDRHSTVLALGGGVTGDLVGFAAATYMRGLALVQAPTSLLAMVDSSVGGKVGVDLPQGKNLVGAFKQPAGVIVDPTVLETLPEREIRCGMAEALKHGLLSGQALFESLVTLHRPPNWLDDHAVNPREYFRLLAELLPAVVQVKIDLVEADPFEQGVRAHLNLGHTFAHAIEQASNYMWPHGEAVGLGLLCAALLSLRLGLCSADVVYAVRNALHAVSLPRHLGSLDAARILAAMGTDKKWRDGHSRFILLESVGTPRIVDGVPASDVLAVLESVR